MIDIAIIGGGPAGLSAAINIVARNKKPVVFARKSESSAIWKAEKINNHLGMPDMAGSEIMKHFTDHAEKMQIEVKEGRVLQIMPMGEHFMINFDNEFIESKAIILSTGIEKGKKIKGEDEYLGKGVSYCATCDGMLYKGKDVLVISETEEGEEDSRFLSEVCGKVYYVNMSKKQVKLKDGIELLDGKVTEILGSEFVEGVKIGENKIDVEGVFFVKASTPIANVIYGLETQDNAIVVDRQMQTSIKGVFACGDNTGRPFQLSKAIGEGQIAGQSAAKYVSSLESE